MKQSTTINLLPRTTLRIFICGWADWLPQYRMTPPFERNQISSPEDMATIGIGFSSLGGARQRSGASFSQPALALDLVSNHVWHDILWHHDLCAFFGRLLTPVGVLVGIIVCATRLPSRLLRVKLTVVCVRRPIMCWWLVGLSHPFGRIEVNSPSHHSLTIWDGWVVVALPISVSLVRLLIACVHRFRPRALVPRPLCPSCDGIEVDPPSLHGTRWSSCCRFAVVSIFCSAADCVRA